MQSCPICRASLNGASVCRRCRADLGKVLEVEQRGQMLAVHGWIYGVADGIMRDLGMHVTSAATLQEQYDYALSQII